MAVKVAAFLPLVHRGISASKEILVQRVNPICHIFNEIVIIVETLSCQIPLQRSKHSPSPREQGLDCLDDLEEPPGGIGEASLWSIFAVCGAAFSCYKITPGPRRLGRSRRMAYLSVQCLTISNHVTESVQFKQYP